MDAVAHRISTGSASIVINVRGLPNDWAISGRSEVRPVAFRNIPSLACRGLAQALHAIGEAYNRHGDGCMQDLADNRFFFRVEVYCADGTHLDLDVVSPPQGPEEGMDASISAVSAVMRPSLEVPKPCAEPPEVGLICGPSCRNRCALREPIDDLRSDRHRSPVRVNTVCDATPRAPAGTPSARTCCAGAAPGARAPALRSPSAVD
ncbi:hypothetical protein [Kitasatospora sp. NPDC001225]